VSRLFILPSLKYIFIEPALSRHTSSPVASPLAVHSSTSSIILPSSHPSSLQTYSPSSSKLISELEVSPSNRVSRRDEKPLEPSRVDRAVISPSGEWMATIDAREGDDTFRGEIHLKIWLWKSGCWILNTRIDRPHALKKITAAVFNPGTRKSQLSLVTTGQDGNIKIWRIQNVKEKNGVLEGPYSVYLWNLVLIAEFNLVQIFGSLVRRLDFAQKFRLMRRGRQTALFWQYHSDPTLRYMTLLPISFVNL